MEYRTYSVSRGDKEPLLDFLIEGLTQQGCRIIKASEPDHAPFRLSFETPTGERMGIVCYAFLANQKLTKNRPDDEHRFQVKYGEKDGKLHPIWIDPYEVYTTLFLGINPEAGFFVGADPEVHNPTRFFISVEFKEGHAQAILRDGWHAWEREKRLHPLAEPIEVLVGARKSSLLDYIRFERVAQGLDAGHRQLLAEKMGSGKEPGILVPTAPVTALPKPETLHALARELEMTESQILDMIQSAGRLKMAVRGWAAEEHLIRTLDKVEGVTDCHRLEIDGAAADVSLRFQGSRELTIQCKNVLRGLTAAGTCKLDFQRTRSGKKDPCSRYYSEKDFDLVAACLHAVTEKWTFSYAQTKALDKHKRCEGKLSSQVKLDERWSPDTVAMLSAAARS